MKIAQYFGGESQLVFWAFRYFLGRRTIATCTFARALAKAWPELSVGVQRLIRKELEVEFKRDDEARASLQPHLPLGMDCDREAWENVRKAYSEL